MGDAVLEEGDMKVYGIAVLGFFSFGISVILILTCGIAVSSSLAVCGISSFWLTVFDDCLRYCGSVVCAFLSIQYAKQNTVGHKVNKS